jgi:hypothetical protein
MNQRASWAWSAAIIGGALLWLITAEISGRREAWDAPLYWVVAYPLSMILAGGLAYCVPDKPWRWGLAVMLAQAVVLIGGGFRSVTTGIDRILDSRPASHRRRHAHG